MSQATTELGVWETVKKSFFFYLLFLSARGPDLLIFVAVYLVFATVVARFGVLYLASISPILSVLVAMAMPMILMYGFMPLAIQIHRSIIIGQPLRTLRYWESLASKDTLKYFFLVTLLIFLPWILFQVVGNSTVFVVASLCIAVFAFSFSFALPAFAAGEFVSFANSHELMRGSFFRTLGAVAVVIIADNLGMEFLRIFLEPFQIVSTYVSAGIGLFLVLPFMAAIVSYGYSTATIKNQELRDPVG